MKVASKTHGARAVVGWFMAAAVACGPGGALAQANYRLQIFDPSTDITPWAINDLGVLAGTIFVDGTIYAAVKQGDEVRVLGLGSAQAINRRGQAVGQTSNGPDREAVKWARSGPVVLGSGGADSNATGINDRGETVGTTIFKQGPLVDDQVSYWYRGQATYLAPGSAAGINNLGVVVGTYVVPGSTFVPRATSWDQGQMTLLGGPDSYGNAINDAGQVVGIEAGHPRLWQEGAAIELPDPSGVRTNAFDINRAGDIVGYYFDSAFQSHALLWRKSGSGYVPIDLNDLLRPGAREAGWFLGSARAVNNRGEVVGFAINRIACSNDPQGCVSYGFVLTRSREPDQYPVSAP